MANDDEDEDTTRPSNDYDPDRPDDNHPYQTGERTENLGNALKGIVTSTFLPLTTCLTVRFGFKFNG